MIDTKELLTIENNQKLEIESNTTILTEYERKANEIIIDNDKDYGNANEFLKNVKNKIKDIEDFRKKLVKPLNDYVDNMNAGFKPFKLLADKIKGILEAKILQYNKKRQEELRKIEEEKRQTELKRLQQEKEIQELKAQFTEKKSDEIKLEGIENKIDKIENSPVKVDSSFKNENVKASIRKSWDFEIINDFEVPSRFCSPDINKIKEAIKNGTRVIPGINIFETESIISR